MTKENKEGEAGACLAIPLLGVEREGAGVLGRARAPFAQSKANATRSVSGGRQFVHEGLSHKHTASCEWHLPKWETNRAKGPTSPPSAYGRSPSLSCLEHPCWPRVPGASLNRPEGLRAFGLCSPISPTVTVLPLARGQTPREMGHLRPWDGAFSTH